MPEPAKARPVATGAGGGGNSGGPPSRAGLLVQIRDWDKATKFIVALTALVSAVSLAIGLKNTADKAPVPSVEKVEEKVQHIELRVDGKTDQKGASSEGESLTERVTALEKMCRPIPKQRCLDQQWHAQVLAELGVKGITVINCPDPTELEIVREQQIPGMRGQKPSIVIRTPMPVAGRE